MISRFFIDRPIFASVLSIAITLAGALALFNLPLAQYPRIAPPTVRVDCKFPGASAKDVADAVAAPIEQKVNGVEGMLYMSSQCTNDGSYSLTVTFQHGMDLNMAQVLVQNRVALALPLLPDVIKQAGVTARKRSPDILLSIALNSPDGRYDQLHLSNYAFLHMKDELARLPGVSDVTMFGAQEYSMRVWIDPERLSARGLSATDVVAAIRAQNRQVAAGQIGQPPAPSGQPLQLTVDTLDRLETPEQFGEIILRSTPEGRVVRLKDVAEIELGAKNLDTSTRVNGRPSASLAVFTLPDANALETADIVKAEVARMAESFPDGMQYEIRYDTTPFIRESIAEVYKTLQEAIILVAVVVLLFLQNWRSAIIPLVAVPVGIIGTFAVMAVLGFSINNLTLFGLVLAIGIVVDDAIVVVEAVEHHMQHGLAPRAATIVAMEEVSGPVIAIGLVLTAVFVPCAFITGIVGQFFRQFALTIAASTAISTINSLTLSPALAALLLKPKEEGPNRRAPDVLPPLVVALLGAFVGYQWFGDRAAALLESRELVLPPWAVGWLPPALAALAGGVAGRSLAWLVNRLLAGFFRLFNAGFRLATGAYVRSVGVLLRGSLAVVIAYGGLLYLTYQGFVHTPTGFIPSQDMGYLLVNVQLPDSAAAERTEAVMTRVEEIAHSVDGVRYTVCINGQSLLLSAFGSNFGSMFIILDEFSKRHAPELYGEEIANRLRAEYAENVPDAVVTVLGPPPVRGVGRAGGFKVMVEDRGASDLFTLQEQAQNLADKANKLPLLGADGRPLVGEDGKERPALVNLTSVFRAKVPQLFVDANRTELMSKQVEPRELFTTLQICLGSLYVNDFNLFGRTWQVIVQADPKFRNTIDDVKRLKVRNAQGQMVPIGSLAEVEEVNGPFVLTRYNMYTAAPINGAAGPGVSSGDAIALMEQLARRELLPSMDIEWTELAYLELQAGNTAMIVFGFAVVMVFLVLAAQYESWALPMAVILVVPLCLLCSIAGVRYMGQDINIFTQIGFVVLVGLACKNAILIVEFARTQRQGGLPRRRAALEACRLRLRPIVMTSLAFVLGVVPLLVSQGAGAEMRRTLGTTVFSGMLGVTIFGIVLTPVFFVLVDWAGDLALFRSRGVQAASGVILGIFGLGYARRLARAAAAEVRSRLSRPPRPRRLPAPAATGHANGHARGPADGHAEAPANGHTHRPDGEPGELVGR